MKYRLNHNTRRAGKLRFKVNLCLYFTAHRTSLTALCLPSRGRWHAQPLLQKSCGLAAAEGLMAAGDQAARYLLSVSGLITANGCVCLYAETFFFPFCCFSFLFHIAGIISTSLLNVFPLDNADCNLFCWLFLLWPLNFLNFRHIIYLLLTCWEE